MEQQGEETRRLLHEQQKRNALLSSQSGVAAALRPFFAAPPIETIAAAAATEAVAAPPAAAHRSRVPAVARRTSSSQTNAQKKSEEGGETGNGEEGFIPAFPPVTAVATAEAVLAVSPFPGRRATIVVSAYDRPWDGETTRCRDPTAFVTPTPLPPASSSPAAFSNDRHSSSEEEKTEERKRVPREGGPYALGKLFYVLGDGVVPFTGLLCALARAGLAPMTSREALLQTQWSLKWVRHPLRSDFAKLRPHAHQKLNHFPGTWRLDKKSTLHQALARSRQRWNAWAAGAQPGGCGDSYGAELFPAAAWVLPAETEPCLAALRDRANRGKLFIVKPVGSSCGRGMYLVRGDANATIPEAARDCGSNSNSNSSNKDTVLVQRYVDDPYLVHGYKFDLRLYVVATSYAPLRLYLFREGLVRFATTPYYTSSSASEGGGGGGDITDANVLTAHLTNFTVNKKSEDFAVPRASETGPRAPGDNGDGSGDGAWASKWCLAALKEYVLSEGLDWGATMDAVKDLLVKVFASVAPAVRTELKSLHEGEMCRASPQFYAPGAPPCTYKGVSPYFEIYGVDVLLRRPEDRAGAALRPVIMEVNIMPSLSTHYSPLDQCIKANFLASTLTLIGLSSPLIKAGARPTSCGDGGDAFLGSLGDTAAVEACLTAEEEARRARHCFDRLFPSPTSFEKYCALLSGSRCSEDGDGVSPDVDIEPYMALDRVLSAWEKSKLH